MWMCIECACILLHVACCMLQKTESKDETRVRGDLLPLVQMLFYDAMRSNGDKTGMLAPCLNTVKDCLPTAAHHAHTT